VARVELDRIAKRYDNGFEAVREVSLDIADGEFVVLVGPSGCGKTTTLRMIAGLESITGGELRIDGRRVNDLHPRDRDIAMVFQSYALYPHMTVYDNMAFGLKLRGTPKDQIRARVDEAAAMLGLEDLLANKPRQLSGGQRQRVAMGRAIVRRASVFLFDEPLSNLDAKLRLETRMQLSRLHRRLGATSIYVTHDQVEAMTLADRIVLMKSGRVQQIGAPLELFERPQNLFVATFLGSPAMNLLPARLEGGDLVADGFRLPVTGPRGGEAGRPVVAGIRPQHVRLGEGPVAARVELVEPLGTETFVHCRVGEGTIVARVEGAVPVRAGEPVSLAPDPAHLHLFDPQTEARLPA
jgi:ABC-type sugar transport system ATPase subunit